MVATPSGQRKELPYDAIKSRLDAYMKGRVYPGEIATTFNFVLRDEFEKAGLKPVFVGQYFTDPAECEQTRVYCHQGTEACSPIPIKRGVIGHAARTGEDQYVPDVTNDSNHVSCDPDMEGSELVLVSLSDPYKEGQYKGCSIPLGVLDLDFNVKEALSEKEIQELRKIWDKYGKLIFPGEPTFAPKGELFIRRTVR